MVLAGVSCSPVMDDIGFLRVSTELGFFALAEYDTLTAHVL